jgi:Flp pilus assembly protein TadB
MMSFAKEQTLRKKEISRGVIGVAALVGMSALIFLMLIYMNPGLIEQLQTSTIGQIIVSINVFAYLVGILVVEKLARFDF